MVCDDHIVAKYSIPIKELTLVNLFTHRKQRARAKVSFWIIFCGMVKMVILQKPKLLGGMFVFLSQKVGWSWNVLRLGMFLLWWDIFGLYLLGLDPFG